MSETKVNSSFLSKLRKTVLNKADSLPDITGKTLGEFHADRRMNLSSGEADIYRCSGTGSHVGEGFVLKYYRRENAVKQDVLEKLRGIKSPCVAPVTGYGSYEGHQYAVRPYYEMPALSEVLASGTTLSEEELKTLIIPSVITGLKALHDIGILHKDLKPANLLPDNTGEHIVLIDFGISSDAGKNTFVVTETGMTPFYAAPEAMQGIFHKETDYYALGITIFELFTGFTPFQNPGLSPEEAGRLAAISKIEFPKTFPEDLKKLVLGLTYKDISHRNEKDNPNRRWGYDEVRRWLNGEEVPVPGESTKHDLKFLPYSFNGISCATPEDLAAAMLKEPDLGIRDLGRGLITHHFGMFDNSLARHCLEAENSLGSNRGENLRILHRLIHVLVPECRGLFFAGREFCDFAELADFLFDIGVRMSGGTEKETDKPMVSDALLYLREGIWADYAQNVLGSPSLSRILHSLNEMSKGNDSARGETLLAMGYALSERCREIVCQGKKFSDLKAFGKELTALSSRSVNEDPFLKRALSIFKTPGFLAYLSFVLSNDSKVKALLSDIDRALFWEPLNSCSLSEKALYVGYRLSGSFIFRMGDRTFENIQDWDQYLERLSKDDRTMYLRFLNQNRHALDFLKAVFSGTDAEKLVQNRIDDTTCAVFGDYEYQFRNGREFNEFLDRLVHEKRFRELRKMKEKYGFFLRALDRDYWKNDSLTKLEKALSRASLLDRLKAAFVSGSPEMITVNGVPAGIIKFGSYPQNNGSTKEPIEWLVLEMKGNEVLLISRYGLDCKPYNHEFSGITWENCDLRNWLNHEFLKAAFSAEEQRRIILTEVTNDANQKYHTRGGNNTRDHVFCLSLAEAKLYFKNDSERRCRPTAQAKVHGAYSSGDGYCWWWLRSPGINQGFASNLGTGGALSPIGDSVSLGCSAVRPALRLIWNQ